MKRPHKKAKFGEIGFLYPYADGIPASWLEEDAKREKLMPEKPKPKMPSEPPTIISKEELNRHAVRADKRLQEGNRTEIYWEKVRSKSGNTTDQAKTSVGSHTNSVGGSFSNLGEGNHWCRPKLYW